jgi:hypothetical protein
VADNITLNSGTGGAVLAADDISSVYYPIGKVAYGALDSATLVSQANGFPVQPATGSVFAASQSGTWNLGTVATITNVVHVDDNSATLSVDDGGGTLTVDGTLAAQQSGTWTVQPGDTPNTIPWLTAPQPVASGGLSVFRSLDLDETEEDVKTSAGCLYKLRITNRATSARYVKLYNATAANVTVGTTTPLDTIPVPGNATDYTVLTENFGGLGLAFATALSIAATTGFADNDTGAPATNDVIVSAYYK